MADEKTGAIKENGKCYLVKMCRMPTKTDPPYAYTAWFECSERFPVPCDDGKGGEPTLEEGERGTRYN